MQSKVFQRPTATTSISTPLQAVEEKSTHEKIRERIEIISCARRTSRFILIDGFSAYATQDHIAVIIYSIIDKYKFPCVDEMIHHGLQRTFVLCNREGQADSGSHVIELVRAVPFTAYPVDGEFPLITHMQIAEEGDTVRDYTIMGIEFDHDDVSKCSMILCIKGIPHDEGLQILAHIGLERKASLLTGIEGRLIVISATYHVKIFSNRLKKMITTKMIVAKLLITPSDSRDPIITREKICEQLKVDATGGLDVFGLRFECSKTSLLNTALRLSSYALSEYKILMITGFKEGVHIGDIVQALTEHKYINIDNVILASCYVSSKGMSMILTGKNIQLKDLNLSDVNLLPISQCDNFGINLKLRLISPPGQIDLRNRQRQLIENESGSKSYQQALVVRSMDGDRNLKLRQLERYKPRDLSTSSEELRCVNERLDLALLQSTNNDTLATAHRREVEILERKLALLETTVKSNEEKAAVVEGRLFLNEQKVEIIESENSKMLTNMEKQLALMAAMQVSIANNRSPSSAITVRERPRTVMVYPRSSRRRRTPNGVIDDSASDISRRSQNRHPINYESENTEMDDSATDAPRNSRNSRQLMTPGVNLQYEDNLDQA